MNSTIEDTITEGIITRDVYIFHGYNPTTEDIINKILNGDKNVSRDCIAFAEDLRGYCLEETLNNIWFVLTSNVEFIEDKGPTDDTNGKQALKYPGQVWKARKKEAGGTGEGADCKSFSLFIASCLQALDIPYLYRFVSALQDDNVHHVYVVVPQEDGSEFIVDATLDQFNKQMPFAYKREHFVCDEPGCKADEVFTSYLRNNGIYDERQLIIKKGDESPGKKYANGMGFLDFILNGFKSNQTRNTQHPTRIGDITDQWLLNLAPNKRDALRQTIRDNIKTASPVFLYLFYFRTAYNDPRPLPRAALYKLKTSLELYIEFSKAFEMHMRYALAGFRCVIDMIDAYFKNQDTLTRVARFGESDNWWDISLTTVEHIIDPANFGTANDQTFLYDILQRHGYQSGVIPIALTNPLPSPNVTWNIPLSAESICALYVDIMYYKIGGSQPTELYHTLEMLPVITDTFRDFQRDHNAPANMVQPEDVIHNSFARSVDNAWVTAFFTAKEHNSGNLVVMCLADEFQRAQFASMYPAGKWVYLDLRFYTKYAGMHSGAFKVMSSTQSGNSIGIELDIPAPTASQNIIAGVFALPPIITTKEGADQYLNKTAGISGMKKVTGVKLEKILGLHCGAYALQFQQGPMRLFDPDGLDLDIPTVQSPAIQPPVGNFTPFTLTNKTAYISSVTLSGVEGAKIGEPITLIVSILSAIATIATTIAGIVASIKNISVSTGQVPAPTADYRFDWNTCKWTDSTQTLLTCQTADGSWVLVDPTTGAEQGADPQQGRTTSTYLKYGLLALAAVALTSKSK